MVEAMVSIPCHLIVTMRAKTEWVIEDVDNGKGGTHKAPRRVGMAPVQREGLEYEFDIVGDMTGDHDWIITKTRCDAFDGAIIRKPGEAVGEQVLAWLHEAEPAAAQPAAPAVVPLPSSRARAAEAVAPQQPAAAEPPKPPTFSARADWSGSAQWAGKPLESAPASALEAYRKALDLAIANPKNKARLRALSDHIGQVTRAWQTARAREKAEAAADPFAEAEPANGWDLSGTGIPGADDAPLARANGNTH